MSANLTTKDNPEMDLDERNGDGVDSKTPDHAEGMSHG